MDETAKMLSQFLGKNVRIYPGDSYKKTGIVRDVTERGVLFEITSYSGKDDQYVVGKLHFISLTGPLDFREI